MNFKDIWERIKARLTIGNVLLLILFGSLFYILKFAWTSEIIATGDLPGHYYLCEKMLQLLQQFRISGYDSNWFGGYPLFTFYNPLPYIVVCFLHLISFKLIPLSGCFNFVLLLQPFLFLISTYYTSNAFFRNKKVNLLSVFFAYLILVTLTANNFGVGILGEFLAGFFTNAFAWPFFIFFIGFLEKARQQNGKKYLVLSSAALSALILSHIFTTVFAGIYLLFFTLFYYKTFWKKALLIFIISLSLTLFWWLPLLLNITYSSGDRASGLTMGDPIIGLFSQPLFGLFLLVFSVIGIIRLFKEKKGFLPSLFLVGLIFLPRDIFNEFIKIPLHYYRFTSGLIIINIFISAYGFNYIIDKYFQFNGKHFTLKSIIFWIFFISLNTNIEPHFHEDYFYKNIYVSEQSYLQNNNEIMDFFAANKEGRIYIDNYASNRFLEGSWYSSMVFGLNNIPAVEGLIAESSLSSNYFSQDRILFDYISLDSSITEEYKYDRYFTEGNSFQNIELENLFENIADVNRRKIESSIKNMTFYGVKYIIVSNIHHTPIFDYAKSSLEKKLVSIKKEFGDYAILEINSDPQPIIASTDYKPFVFVEDGIFSLQFKDFSKKWYGNGYAVDYPVIHTGKNIEELSEYELSQINGYILSTNECPRKQIDYLVSTDKPVIVIGAKKECDISSDSVIFIKKKKEKSLDKKDIDLTLKEDFVAYKEIYKIVSSLSGRAEYQKIFPEAIGNEYIKFNGNKNTLINYSYFPKWKSEDKNQTIFWATPSFMFIIGSGSAELRYK